ncbi:hypothetical protein TNCV_432741 [Trichonephila clavipes]|nr:hypothetical protein TNCV_432741 [Trichonephila clavipes]
MRHETSCKEMQAYTAEELQPTKWIVYKTVANGINPYEVNKVKDCDCPIRCHKCQICIHSLTCNCVDYAVRFTICKHIHYVCQKFPFMVVNVSDETVLLVDEDSNRLRREKEKKAILKEKEMSVVHEEPTKLVYEQFMGVSPFCSSLPSIQHFPANKNIVQQRVQQKSRHFKKQKLANDATRREGYNCEKRGSPYREMPPYHVSMQAYTLDTSAIAILEMHS